MKQYRYFIYGFAILIISAKLAYAAPVVKPRIAALAGDSTYVSLLQRESTMGIKEDSLSQLLVKYRNEYAQGATSAGNAIMKVESELFDLRSARTLTIESINSIEQQWVANNPSQDIVEITTEDSDVGTIINSDDDIKSIANSRVAALSLPDLDLQNLTAAEQMESSCADIYEEYMAKYDRLVEIDSMYNLCEDEEVATGIYKEYRKVANISDSLSRSLSRSWSQLYDNKNFAYGMLLEVKGYNDLLDRSVELVYNTEAQITAIVGGESTRAAIDYNLQKGALLAIEELIAERLELGSALDSLKVASDVWSRVDKITALPEVIVAKRSFILYEPIRFSTSETYNTSSNPVPETVVYKKGTIYRIQYGAYKSKQLPSIFRQAYPLSYDRALGFWTYYGGGYATYAEAVEAVAISKRRGFNRPEVVVWRDGERRNLYRQPLPQSKGYRIEITGVEELSDVIKSAIDLHCKGAELSKIGVDKYVISPVENVLYAEDFVKIVTDFEDGINVEVSEIK